MDSTLTRVVYDSKTFEPQRSVGRKLGRVKLGMSEALDRELEPLGITAAQFVILVSLALGEADSASGLCRGISYDPGAMTRMIDRLEQKGLIRRTQLPDDRRRVGLELTAEGKAVYPKLRAAAPPCRTVSGGFTRASAAAGDFPERMLANG
jgi:DNA-binding MarR family transcriptional regulator